MPITKLFPCFGMNTATEDGGLVIGGKAPGVYFRDIVNANVTPAGKLDMVPSGGRVSDTPYRYLWQSPLHKDTFAMLGGDWVKVVPGAWTHEVLATIGAGPLYHTMLNNQVCVSSKHELYIYNGVSAEPLTIATPPKPIGSTLSERTEQVFRSVAISWCRNTLESGLSELGSVGDIGGIVQLPMVTDPTVTSVNVYCTQPGGTDLQLAGSVSPSTPTFELEKQHKLGRAAAFKHLSPMKPGKYLSYWRGRLLTATGNVLRFSEPLAYHLHDERHGFIQTPQRITFVEPVGDGIWVGQVDHVLFLQGQSPSDMSVVVKSSMPPVPDSATQTDSEVFGEISEGGNMVAVWLASNGYVAGNSTGQAFELQAGKLDGITANSSTTVRLARRLVTLVS